MKMYLNKLNKRIDTLMDALRDADKKMVDSNSCDQKLLDQVSPQKSRRNTETLRITQSNKK